MPFLPPAPCPCQRKEKFTKIPENSSLASESEKKKLEGHSSGGGIGRKKNESWFHVCTRYTLPISSLIKILRTTVKDSSHTSLLARISPESVTFLFLSFLTVLTGQLKEAQLRVLPVTLRVCVVTRFRCHLNLFIPLPPLLFSPQPSNPHSISFNCCGNSVFCSVI